MALETTVYWSSNYVILKFYRKVYFSDIEACQGLHLFPLRDVMSQESTITLPAVHHRHNGDCHFKIIYYALIYLHQCLNFQIADFETSNSAMSYR